MKREINKINVKISLYETLIKGLESDSHESDDNQERIGELKNIIKGLNVALLIIDKKLKKRCKRAKKILYYTDESDLVEMVRIIDKFAEADDTLEDINTTMIDHIEGVEVVGAYEFIYTVSTFLAAIY